MVAPAPHARIGEATEAPQLRVRPDSEQPWLIDAEIDELKEAWQAPLRW
jgi:hypothetical protein